MQAGLTGEVLGRDLAIAEMKEGAQAQAQTQDGNDEGSWEDKKQFEREQGIEGNGVNVGGEEAMDVDDTEAAVEGNAAGTLDKEERKKLKKERRKAEKKAKLKETEE